VSRRLFVRILIVVALLNYIALPAVMFAVAIALPLLDRDFGTYLGPVSALLVAVPVALAVAARCRALNLTPLWAVPALVWVVSSSTFAASAPLSIALIAVSGHYGAALDMLGSAYAPLALLVFLALYRPPAQRWRGQGTAMLLIWLAALAETVAGMPRTLRVVGGWFNLMALANPLLGDIAAVILRAQQAIAAPIATLLGYEQAVLVLPLHALVFCAGLLILGLEGDWDAEGEGEGEAAEPLAPFE
jgi:hypothetical protein